MMKADLFIATFKGTTTTLLSVVPLKRKGGRVARIFRVPYNISGAANMSRAKITDFFVRDKYSLKDTIRYYKNHRSYKYIGAVQAKASELPNRIATELIKLLVVKSKPMPRGWFNNGK